MLDFLKLAIIFAAIVYCLRKKLFVGYILFCAGILTAIFFGLNYKTVLNTFLELLKSADFWKLYVIIVLITFLGRILRSIGYLDKLVAATDNLIGGARVAVMVLPGLVGMMPMPGGALLSAPLVGSVLRDQKYSAAFKTVVNYWSRHVIEFCWPVYPGVIITAVITGLPVGKLALLNLPMTLIMIPLGYLLIIRKIDKRQNKGEFWRPLIRILARIWPILAALLIAVIFNIPLVIGIAIALVLLLIYEHPKASHYIEAGKPSLSPRLFILVFGVLSFQKILEYSGAVASINSLTTELGFPVELVIIIVAFLSGLLTGILFALIGLSFPLLAGFLYQPDINMAHIFLAFVSGYVGMIFSPTHFCLILTIFVLF
jgi:integral membrane protein (TIGR00529 family)